MSYETFQEYKRNMGLEQVTRLLFVAACAGSAAYMWTVWQEITLIQKAFDGQFPVMSTFQNAIMENDTLKRYTFIGARVIGAVAWIAGLAWIYQVTVNARAISSVPLDTSPGWAVGSFFIPFFNLFLPFSSLREVVRASSPLKDSSDGPLIFFWLSFVAYFVTVGVSRFLAVNAITLQEVARIDWITLGSEICAILTNVFFISLTWSLARKQEKRRAEVLQQLQSS